MPKLSRSSVPSYCRHRASGQAIVKLDGKAFYLGPYGSKVSRREYDRLVGEWVANGRRLPSNNGHTDHTVNELCSAYWTHAESHYRKPDGSHTSELGNLKYPIRNLKQLYGHTVAKQFGPLSLKAVRQAMIDAKHCRSRINRDVDRIKRVFKWGVVNEMIPPEVYHGLQAVSGLRRGRSEAPESGPVRPVPEEFVVAILPHVRPQIAAMIRLQMVTGMRSGELSIMRTCDLDTSGKLWTYKPSSHKTEHHGHEKVIYLGPKAQDILKPWLKSDLQSYLFSPRESKEAWYVEKRLARKSKVPPSQAARTRKRNPKKRLRDFYSSAAYHHAVEQGIAKANELITDDALKIPHWHPHQLRHNAATRLRKEYGIEAARVVLGHRSAAITEVYAEIDHAKAADIMLQVG